MADPIQDEIQRIQQESGQRSPAPSIPNENQPTPAARPGDSPNAIDEEIQNVLDQKVTRAIPDKGLEEKRTVRKWVGNAWKSFWQELDDIRKANLGKAAEDMMAEINDNPVGIFKSIMDVTELESHYRIRTGFMGQGKNNNTLKGIRMEREKAYQKLAEEAPTLGNIFYESYSVWGDGEKVMKTLYEQPFRILTTILPHSKYLQGVKGSGKLARGTRRAGKILPHLDPGELPFTAGGMLGKTVARWKNRGLAKEDFNRPFDATYGRDTKSGVNEQVTTTPVEMAEKIGTGAENTPALVLSENPTVHHNEMTRHQSGGAGSRPVQSRFEQSQKGYETTLDDIKDREITKSRDLTDVINSVFDIEEVGGLFRKKYEKWQLGLRSDFNERFKNIGAALDMQLRSTDFPLLNKTRAELDRLKSDHSKLSNNARQSIQIAEQTLSEAFANLAQDGLTIRDFDQYRTEFRWKFEDAIHQAGLRPIGSGDPVTRLYHTLTDDFYDLLETEVALNPSDFPDNFLETVKTAKKDYAKVKILEQTDAAAFIRDNFETPHYIVNRLLNRNTSNKFIRDAKEVIGGDWDILKPGLLIAFLDKVSGTTQHFRWGGLKSEIAKLNGVDKNRLKTLFGDDLAKELAALGEFGLKFSKEGRWTKGTPTGFINKLVQSPSFLSLLHNIANVLPFIGTGYGGIKVGMGSFTPTDAVMIAGLTTAFLGERWWNNFLNSDASRKWMLEGHTWQVVKKDGTVVTITPEDFKLANEYIVVPFLKENKFKSKGPIRGVMRTGRSTERGKRQQTIPKPNPDNPFGTTNPFRIQQPVE